MAAAACAGLGARKLAAPAAPSIPSEPCTEKQRVLRSPRKVAEVPLGCGVSRGAARQEWLGDKLSQIALCTGVPRQAPSLVLQAQPVVFSVPPG